MFPCVQNTHFEELLCVENRQEDILSDDSLQDIVGEDSSSEDQMNPSSHKKFEQISADKFQGETSQNNGKEVEPSFSKWLEVDEPVAVWFKLRGEWHAGIKCARADWPLSVVKDKPTNDKQNKCLVIFSPETGNYSWVDMILVQSIDEFPKPIPYKTYQEGLKMVQDLGIARWFIMQKLAVEMLYMVDQLHLNALIEDYRNVTVWKQFAMEASHCQRYSDLGRMVQRLQNSIMQHYIKDNWKVHFSESWAERCPGANSAEIIEQLQEELFDSILWNDVHTLRDAPTQQKLNSEWKTWNHDVMKWFSTFISFSSNSSAHQHSFRNDGLYQASLQDGSKRPKLNVRRANTFSRHEGIVEVPVETALPSQLISPLSKVTVHPVDSEMMFNNGTISRSVNEMDFQISVEPDTKGDAEYRRCQAYIEAKGRQCVRTAIGNDIYCCAHFSRKKEKCAKVLTPMCCGTTIVGTKCKHHSFPSFPFCKKHMRNVEMNKSSNCHTLKRKAEESCSGSKSHINNDLVLVHPESSLEIDPTAFTGDDDSDDDSFSAKNILGETLMLSGNDYNEIETLHQTGSPKYDNDRVKYSCFDNENANKCKICFEEFSNDQTLGDHWMENHIKEARWLFRSYACAICFDPFSNKKLLESHVQNRHHVPFIENCLLLLCIPCGSHFGNMEELWLHVKSVHHAEFKLAKASEELTLPTNDDPHITIEQGNEASLDNNNFENPSGSRKLSCRFCGLKFDLLPDLGRHHQAAHMERGLARRRLAKRGVRYYAHRLKTGTLSRPKSKRCFKEASNRIKRSAGVNLKRRNQARKLNETGETSMQQPHVNETTCIAELEESQCLEVANILFSDIHQTQPQPKDLDILSIACTACCKDNLEASLKEKYGYLPEKIYLKAAKLCSENELVVNWHLDGFICPRGCNALNEQNRKKIYANASDPASIEMKQDGSQSIINSKHTRLGSSQKAIKLCNDVSSGMESTPVICVMDLQILDSLCEQEQYLNLHRPWESFTYVTKPMFGRLPSHDYEGLQLKCHCSSSTCCRETCDHVYLFDNDYDTAKDIFGKSMRGKFPYDNNGRIILEEGYLVYECNEECKCDKTCPNRILQNGIRVKLEIFKTEKKGWGVRAGEAISRGTFVCEYIGEVLDEQEARNRRERYGKEHCNYFYDVDAHVNDMSRLIEREARYVIDSTRYGNVSRFINNSCSPNLVNYQVLVESMDCKRSHIGLYASQDIAKGEELTYNYHYELVDGEGSPCLCGSSKCRNRLY